jgi:hypothetical protein
MPFSEMVFQADMIEQERIEETKNSLISAAYTSWLLGAGERKSFGAYLKYLGLSDKESKLPETQKKMITEKAHRIAERIMKMDKPKEKAKP